MYVLPSCAAMRAATSSTVSDLSLCGAGYAALVEQPIAMATSNSQTVRMREC